VKNGQYVNNYWKRWRWLSG